MSYCPHVEKYVVRINLVHVVIKCPLSTVATTFSVQSCGANHCSMTVSFKCRGEQEKLLGGGYYLWHVCLEENLTVYHLVQHIKHPILRIPNFNFPNLRFCKVFFSFQYNQSYWYFLMYFDINLKILSGKNSQIVNKQNIRDM